MNKKFELCTGLEEKRNFFPPGLYHNILKSSSPNPFPQLLRFEEKSNLSDYILFVILTFEHLQNNRLKMENKNHFFLISSNKNKNGS